MDFFRRLFGRAQAPSDPALHLYVRCDRCKAAVHVRVHRYNDLSAEYDESGAVMAYHLRKEMMDARCFRLMYAAISFDRTYRELSRTIEGGSFISQAEYEDWAQSQNKP